MSPANNHVTPTTVKDQSVNLEGLPLCCRQPIIVTGMHRSGTSLVSRLLSELGVKIGDELDNHYESQCFKKINEQLLQTSGAYWAKPQPFLEQINEEFIQRKKEQASRLWNLHQDAYGPVPRKQPWGWKDPRNTITLPVWLALFPEAKVINVIRDGIDVALSLHRRELRKIVLRYRQPAALRSKIMFPPTIAAGYRLWATYIEVGVSHKSLSQCWLSLRYEDLLTQPEKQLDKMCRFIEINATDDLRQRLSQRIIRQPTPHSWFDVYRVRRLVKKGKLAPGLLQSLGYSLP